MLSFPAFVIKNKIKISANFTYLVWEKCQFSINFNFNFNFKSWETGHKSYIKVYTDGSQIDFKTGCAFSIKNNHKMFNLGETCSLFTPSVGNGHEFSLDCWEVLG
jgi:hypothetical protein